MARNIQINKFPGGFSVNWDGLVAAFIATLMALFVYHGWPLSHLATPLSISGDSTEAQYLIKTIIEHGWYLNNPDVGAPFTGTVYDFPIPEPTSFGFIWLLGLLTKNPFLVFNLFYLASFAAVALAACWGFKKLGIERSLAVAGAVAFAILPYHFLRLPHLFLASYFASAIFCCYALGLAMPGDEPGTAVRKPDWKALLLLAVAAGGGVYYAFFGCIFIVSGALIGAAQRRNAAPLRTAAIYLLVIVAVIAVSLLPNFFFHLFHGSNPLVAARSPADAEVYGLRITQMLYPTTGHRLDWLGALTAAYNKNAPYVDENMMSALGVMGSIGFLVSIAVALFGGYERQGKLGTAGKLILVGVLFATIGGFGALFARFVTPDMRGLNRISVFIAFFGLFAFIAVIQNLARRKRVVFPLLAILVIGVAWTDEIPTHGLVDPYTSGFYQQKAAYSRLQAALPPGTAIYELPYMSFPEGRPAGYSYDLFYPYLHTNGLRWSFGAMRGRAADIWNKQVSELSGAPFVEALEGAGFGAIYVDRRIYPDHGDAVIGALTKEFGAPVLQNFFSVYRIPAAPSHALHPYIAVAADDGWNGPEKLTLGGKTTTWQWSKGNANLTLVNPNHTTSTLTLRFSLSTLRARHVAISYEMRPLAQYDLLPGHSTAVVLSIKVMPGTSRIVFTTDTPPRNGVPNGDPRTLSMRMTNLTFGLAP
ncbi:MAG: hypothetical protein ABI132_01675 [Rhodanobacteraceae bacterium]